MTECVLALPNKSKQSKRSMNALKAPNAEHILFGKRHSSPIIQSEDSTSFALSPRDSNKNHKQTVNSIFSVTTECRPNYASAQQAIFSCPINKYKQ